MKTLATIWFTYIVPGLFPLLLLTKTHAQQKTAVRNDVTAPLHALQPDYPVPYKAMPQQEIKSYLDRVFNYLNAVTPARMINKSTGKEVNDIVKLDTNTIVEQRDFRLSSYEWGVTYSAMLRTAEITGDKKYADYVNTRFDFLAKWIPVIKEKFSVEYIRRKNLFAQPINLQALDDAGAVCATIIKATRNGSKSNLRPLIDNYIDFVANKEYRLSDGTLGRNRPQKNTLWLDDLYMGVPALAQMGKLTGDIKYFDDAVKQVLQFSQRMYNKEKGLYMHGWVEGMTVHPQFH